MPTIAPHSAFTELAAVLAHGYLRLTQIARNSAVSDSENLQKELDVSRPESPHLLREFDAGGFRGKDRAR